VHGPVHAGGGAADLILGGVLTELVGGRSVFLINVPVGTVVVAASLRALPEGRPRLPADDRRGRLELELGDKYSYLCLIDQHSGEGEEDRAGPRITLRYTFPQELAALLDRNGLTIVRRYGDWNGVPLTVASPSIIVVCRMLA
jgi:MFS family permease